MITARDVTPVDRFIVAEVSVNWHNGVAFDGDLVATRFETVINANHDRGYRLVSFALDRVMTSPNTMNETIVAVFERIE